MRTGSIIIIDAFAAFLIIILLGGAIVYLSAYQSQIQIKSVFEKEMIRAEFYNALFSGKVNNGSIDGGNVDLGGRLSMSTSMPTDQPFIEYFFTYNGGIKLFYIFRKE